MAINIIIGRNMSEKQ